MTLGIDISPSSYSTFARRAGRFTSAVATQSAIQPRPPPPEKRSTRKGFSLITRSGTRHSGHASRAWKYPLSGGTVTRESQKGQITSGIPIPSFRTCADYFFFFFDFADFPDFLPAAGAFAMS
jgi:hypothetical protein